MTLIILFDTSYHRDIKREHIQRTDWFVKEACQEDRRYQVQWNSDLLSELGKNASAHEVHTNQTDSRKLQKKKREWKRVTPTCWSGINAGTRLCADTLHDQVVILGAWLTLLFVHGRSRWSTVETCSFLCPSTTLVFVTQTVTPRGGKSWQVLWNELRGPNRRFCSSIS